MFTARTACLNGATLESRSADVEPTRPTGAVCCEESDQEPGRRRRRRLLVVLLKTTSTATATTKEQRGENKCKEKRGPSNNRDA